MRQGSLFDLLPSDNPDEAIGLAGMMPAVRAEMNRVSSGNLAAFFCISARYGFYHYSE